MPIEPARLACTDDGTPYSEHFGDVYHSRDGGLAQARHVFLAGNDLPARWQGRDRFVVLETGFGLGLNFLAAWAAWRADRTRCGRLHFVSVELHPFTRDDLAILHARWHELAALSAELRAQWPPLTPGMHRLHLDGGRVTLTLLLGDAERMLPQVECRADAFFLDGFSPARNPSLWSDALLRELGRLAAPGASLATWSVSGAVRRGLDLAGFDCDKAPGFSAKREMLRGIFREGSANVPAAATRRALVVGAGLAGTSVANRLAERGWHVAIVDAADRPGQGASGNLGGVLRPLPSLDDNRLARITRAGALYGVRHLQRLVADGHPVRWSACGVLHLARDPTHEAKQRKVVEAQRPPPEFLQFVERDEASRLAGWPLPLGGWWFPGGAWVRPPDLCVANLSAGSERITGHFGRAMRRLVPTGDGWTALDQDGQAIASAPVAILANGVDIRQVPQASALPVRSARGQVSHLTAATGSPPDVVVCRLGYVGPAIDGVRSFGATFSVDDDDPALRDADHLENIAKLEFILPGWGSGAGLGPGGLDGRVGFRPASPDRLPMVGAVPVDTSIARNTPLPAIARVPGLYALSGFGARGLVWAALAGELLGSLIDGDPLPLERELVDALDAGRFLVKPARGRLVSDA